MIALSGYPARPLGWNQFRALGAAALDLCAVACGMLDGYVDCLADAHGSWDYLGGMLVCHEAGAPVVDALGRDLVVLSPRGPAHAGGRGHPRAAGGPAGGAAGAARPLIRGVRELAGRAAEPGRRLDRCPPDCTERCCACSAGCRRGRAG